MFTGLVQGLGGVRAVEALPAGRRLTLDLGPLAEGARVGDSIAVAGVCLTVAALRGTEAAFDVSEETLSRTHLGDWTPGCRVNLEGSLRLGDRLGGHFVTGHVDAVGSVLGLEPADEFLGLRIQLPPALLPLVVEKGSIAVDGVSLTVAALDEGSFTVALIPETLRRTTLGAARVGARVHLEADLLGKHVQRLLATARPATGP